MCQGARGGQETLGHILRIKPRLKRMSVDRQFVLAQGQPLACRHAQLPGHQINAGNRLGHGMFHLQTGVHLHEKEAVRLQPARAVDDEFNRARPGIADRLGCCDRRLPHRFAHFGRHAGGRSLLDHLLVAPLKRAIAFKQMHGLFAVAKDLHFDMARFGDEFLDQHIGVAKGCLGLGARTLQRGLKTVRRLHQPHALATPTGDGLDQHRIADLIRLCRQQRVILIGPVIPRHNRHARLDHQGLGGIFKPHRADGLGRRADKDQPRRLYRIHEIGVLGQKAIARMDRLRARIQCRLNDHLAAQIAIRRGRAADMHRRIRHRHMFRRAVRVGIDRHAAHPHGLRCLHHAASNLAPVRNQDRIKHHAVPSHPSYLHFAP